MEGAWWRELHVAAREARSLGIYVHNLMMNRETVCTDVQGMSWKETRTR